MIKLFTRKDKRSKLEKEIDAITIYLEQIDPTDDAYKEVSENLERLYKLQSLKEDKKQRIDPNTVITVLGSLAGILLILKYEKVDVLTSKAIGFVLKGRV